jgi:transposase InsO family protein
MAALKAALRARLPPKGCIHHSDRGSHYASEIYRNVLAMVWSVPWADAAIPSTMPRLRAS